MKRRIIDDEFISRLESITLYMKSSMNGFFGGNHKTKLYGSSVEFADFREYNFGDDIRRIDWNLFSRFEKYFIKQYVDERQMHNQIFLDCSTSMIAGNPDKAFYALQIVAALGYLSVSNMDKTTYRLMYGENSMDLYGLVVGKEAYYNAMSLLENIEFKGSVDINKAIINTQSIGKSDGLTIIVSDFLTENDWKTAVDYLVYNKRQVMLIQVLSPEEIDPIFNGRVAFMDAEMEHPLDSRNMKLRVNRATLEVYRQALQDYQNEIRTFCHKRGVDFITTSCDQKIEKFILHQLQEMEVVK
jgi:uncharacterized protein (DUF58 family)